MSTYAIGDIQGCFPAVERLLEAIAFDPARDRLWLVGDLVNRGTHSLQTLRWARSLGDAAVTVLGNHDLHLLGVAEGFRTAHRNDTLDEILHAPDREDLLQWLRTRHLAYREGDWLMVHAGVLPDWSADETCARAAEVEAMLVESDDRDRLRHLFGSQPDRWDDALTGVDRLRVIVNVLTRIRYLAPGGRMDFHHKGPPGSQPVPLLPWFDFPGRKTADVNIVSGHWSALGLRLAPNLAALDTGCLWGRTLSALRLEDRQLFQCECAGLPGTKPWL